MIDRETILAEIESTVQLILIDNGMQLIAKIEKVLTTGLIISNPVTFNYVDSTLYFNGLFHGMSKTDFMTLPATHIITFTAVNDKIDSYYEDFIKDLNDKTNDFLNNNQQKSSNTTNITYH